MRILDVRVGTPNEASDIADGRAILKAEISHPAKTVMIIRNDTAAISLFAGKAAGRATGFDWREVVWVKNTVIFADGQEIKFFPPGHEKDCAVVLDLDDQPIVWLNEDSSIPDIDDAFLEAGRRQ